ncbi:MAG: UTP--glucose-1-phosphate uridylyltransferase, partial [Candidatus Omnitrophica bacterium]|nr:UTP--glucose-1-phosphate uridylyltransferase [Candidatus Omnitrophota bacterium]
RLTPVEVFDRDEKVIHQVLEADNPDERALAIREKEEEYKQRGETLIRDSNFAFGFTSGLLTRRPADHMDINLTLQIEGTDGRDRRFVEWKFYMLKKMQELYRTSKIPVVIMSGFRTNNLSEQLLRTDNFGYSGPVYLYYQGPTKVMDKKGTPVTVNGEELFATPGAWGYIKWLVISSKLRQLRKDKIRYISHSNVNNPVESVDAATLGYFDHMAEEARKNGREEPLALVQLGQRMRRVGPDGRELWERGGAAVEIEYADGSQERRVVHQDRWPEDSDFLSSTNDNYNLANYIINLDRLWEIFGLEDLEALYDGDKAGETDFKKILAERVAEVEREKKISPILRVRDIMGGDKGVFIDYALDDLTLLGDWLACHVDRKDHFVSLKGFGDLFQYSNAHVMSRKMKQVELDIYRSNNPLVDYLQAKNVIHDLSNTTVEEIRRKILRMFLPSRLFRESEDLVEGIYVPGAYILKEVEKDNEEEANNVAFRDKIADQELGLLAEQFRERLPELDAMRREAKRLWRYVFDLDLDNGVKLRDGITNAESNMIVRQCVKIVFFGTPYTADFNPFASVNRTLNDMALRRLKAKGDGMTIPEILKESVSSVKFKQYSSINQINNENFEAAYGEIEKEIEKANNGNDFSDADNVDLLLSRMLSGKRRVTYITDDNGEIVYHLYLMQRFLERNPELKVTVIPRGGQYGVDASYEDILQVIQSEELFEPIRKMMELPDSRITIVKTSPRLGGIDVRRLSPLARDSIAESDFIISVGCMNYEMLSGIKKESFHILMTHGKTSIRATGKPEGTYNVIHQMPGIQYFKHDEDLIKRMVYDTVAESGSSQRGEKVFGRDEELSRERKEKEKAEDDLERDHGMPGERNIDDGPEGDDQDAPDGSPLSGKEKEDPTNVPQKALSEAAEGFLAYLADVETKIAGMIREPVLIRIPIEAMEIVQDKDVLRTFFRAVTEGRDSDLYFEVFSASGYKVIGEDEYARFGIKQRTLPESLKERNRTNTLTLLMGDPNEGGLPLRTDDIGIRIGDIDIGIGDSLLSPLVLKDDQTGIVRSIMFGLQLTVFSRQIAADPSLARKQSFKDRLQAEVLETFKRTFNVAEKDNVDITPDDLIGLMTGSINDIRRAIVKLIRLIPIEPFEAEELRKIYERTAEILKAA